VEGRGVAGDNRVARDLSAYVCVEDEAGQGLRPPKGRTWAARGARPVVRVRGAGGGAGQHRRGGVLPARAPAAPVLHAARLPPPQGEPKGFSWSDYRDLIIATHRALSAPLVWCWDNPYKAPFKSGRTSPST
jgi:hypothetical protein